MQHIKGSSSPIVIQAKNRPCNCCECVEVACNGCGFAVFQTVEKMEIFNREKGRAYNLCTRCINLLEKIHGATLNRVGADIPSSSTQ
jgi:hypothetical protein